jgi:hypothetical protein
VFTARYALSPHIKQISFVFKGLIPVSVTDHFWVQFSRKTSDNSKTNGKAWIVIKFVCVKGGREMCSV